MLKIGPYNLDTQVALAPMAGVTDRPFRQLCRRMGAGLVVSEMVTSDPSLWHTRKSKMRLNHEGEAEPRSVQIAGGDPEMMATAARLNAERGAQIIDINMGCPAKKVCNKAAGSALLRDEGLVAEILTAVVEAVDLPVTLKMRTGWCPESRNAIRIAQMAQNSGIALLTLHGRTRADAYRGAAEYDTIRAVRKEIQIPLIANGDINSPEKARQVLDYTGADAVMIGRAAQGRPWLLREIDHYLRTGTHIPAPERTEIYDILRQHVIALHQFYGELMGVRIARKHVGWYLSAEPEGKAFRKVFNQIDEAQTQLLAIDQYFVDATAA
ncbi:MAG TPA: tRNA dihydrouridine synthase DusB [Marinobacterium sp.]|nr:tRNA dihydrouridine synthase DusB [Marinobacterium sp.]